MRTLERLESAAESLEAASELVRPTRSVEYLTVSAAVRSELRAQLDGQPLLSHRLERAQRTAGRLADSAPSGSLEERLADLASIALLYVRGEGQ